ncbi:unnamed protein product, partial [Porites lobata]
RKRFTPELTESFVQEAIMVCRQTITIAISHQNWCKVSQQKPVSVRQSPLKFHTRTGANFRSKSQYQSDNHRKRFTPELVQSFAAKASISQAITVNVSHQNWCKVSQQKPVSVRQSPLKFHTRTGAKFRSKSQYQSGNHRKSVTPELVQSFAAKASISQAITVKVSHQNWCKVSQQKPVIVGSQSGNHRKRFTPELMQSFAAKDSSRNHRKSFTPELVQSFTAKAVSLAITVNVSHQNWCKVSQQKPVSVRQSPVKFHTRTGAKFRSKSRQSGNHRKSFTPELVKSFTAKASISQAITVKVSHQNWCKVSQQKP